jgi:PIN domain nuclease of toxin-antitoxin system
LDAQTLMNEPENELIFSVASLWEIVIKCGLGREDFKVDPRLLRRSLLDNDYRELPILSEHAVAINALPPIHKDPFDRMLVAQATVEGITLLTDGRCTAGQIPRSGATRLKLAVKNKRLTVGGLIIIIDDNTIRVVGLSKWGILCQKKVCSRH